MSEEEYAFTGHVIRLVQKDLDRWHKAYAPDLGSEGFLKELSGIDDWLAAKPARLQEGWFFIASAALDKKAKQRRENNFFS